MSSGSLGNLDQLDMIPLFSRASIASSPIDDVLGITHGDHHNLDVSFSHISRLPPEILTHIFMVWFEIEDSDFANTPFLVSHVCSQWRGIAFDTPRLWRNIVLKIRRSNFTDHSLALIGSYLLRSGPHTIDANVLEDSDPLGEEDDEIDAGIQNLVRQVLPILPRIQTLMLYCRSSAVVEAFLAILASQPMPSLKTLNLVFKHMDATELLVRNLIHKDSTRLSSFSIIGDDLRFQTLDGMVFPWGQLSYLDIELLKLDEAFAFLPKCSLLETCILQCVSFRDDGANRPMPLEFELPRLTKLDIRMFFCLHDSLEPFFRPLHAPQLKKFKIEFSQDWWGVLGACYNQYLFTRSGASLTSLQFEHFRFYPGEIVPVLQKLPALEHLGWKCRLKGCVDELFTGLRYNSTEGLPPLVPRLTRLEVETKGNTNQEGLLELIPSSLLSRCHSQDGVVGEPVKALEYVCIRLEVDVDMTGKYTPGTAVGDFRREIERCREAGMEVDMYLSNEEF